MRRTLRRVLLLVVLPVCAMTCVGATSAPAGHGAVAGIMPPVELPLHLM